jgi:mannose-6-phosphate isomerase-like protein (cupin superfamily)
MRKLLRFSFFLACILAPEYLKAQSHQSLDTIKPPAEYENLYIRNLYADSLASSFLIFVKKEVKAHYHREHSEHIYVLEGEGEMQIGSSSRIVKPGEIIFIPMKTVHSLKVTSLKPMKVISIQAPFFDGTDRVLVE